MSTTNGPLLGAIRELISEYFDSRYRSLIETAEYEEFLNDVLYGSRYFVDAVAMRLVTPMEAGLAVLDRTATWIGDKDGERPEHDAAKSDLFGQRIADQLTAAGSGRDL